MKMKRILSLILAAILAVSVGSIFAACSKEKAAGGDLDKITAAGKMVIGITEYEPMNYKDKETGEWTGFDTEYALAVCEALGVEAEFVEINWDNKINELNAGNIDCVWNGMTITDEIKASADVSNAYAENAQVVVMKASELGNYADAASIKDLTIAVEGGSAGEKAAQAQGYANIVTSTTQAMALTEVASGAADACIIDLTMANSMTGEGSANETLGFSIKLEAEEYGIAFRADSDLTAKVNEITAGLIESGELDTIAEKYEINLVK